MKLQDILAESKQDLDTALKKVRALVRKPDTGFFSPEGKQEIEMIIDSLLASADDEPTFSRYYDKFMAKNPDAMDFVLEELYTYMKVKTAEEFFAKAFGKANVAEGARINPNYWYVYNLDTHQVVGGPYQTSLIAANSSTQHMAEYAGQELVVKQGKALPELTEAIRPSNVKAIEGKGSKPGGYELDGISYESEEAEALVDEAKEMATQTGKDWKVVLVSIIPENQLKESALLAEKVFGEEKYRWFEVTAPNLNLARRGKLESIAKGEVIGIRPATSEGKYRVVTKSRGPSIIYSLDWAGFDKLMKQIKRINED